MFDPKIACMTLPYSELPFERAAQGIKTAGFEYLAFGVTHEGAEVPDPMAGEAETLALGRIVEDAGLTAIMMFGPKGGVDGENGAELFRRRLAQAKLLGIGHVVAWGPWEYKEWPDEKWPEDEWDEIRETWFDGMMQVAPHAEELGVQIVLKPHTGVTAYGERLKYAVERIGSEAVGVCYDGGNVHFYEGYDPAEDIKDCAEYVAAFCIKDHSGPRANPLFPPPGEGDVDDAAMLRVVNEHGFSGPLMVERFEGDWAKADMPVELIDERARIARLYLERTLAAI